MTAYNLIQLLRFKGFSPTMSKEYSPLEFRDLDMNGKVIISIKLPAYKGSEYYFKSFKVMPNGYLLDALLAYLTTDL